MGDKFSKSNINNVSGNVFNGTTNIISGNNNNFKERESEKAATYTPELIWRSPITMAILTWLAFFISLIEIFPMYKICEPIINILMNKNIRMGTNNNIYLVIFALIMLVLMMILWLRNITKKETRHPLLFNYAISGLGRKITIEKIQIDKCPKCGGEMKYFNKAIKWRDITYSDGRTKREVIKRVPALRCKRNSDHWFEVDPAAEKLNNKRG